jgi:protein subunit release factor A
MSMEDDLEEIKMFFAYNLNQHVIYMKLENCKMNLQNTALLLQTLEEARTILENTLNLHERRDYQDIKDKVEHLIETLRITSVPTEPSDNVDSLLSVLKTYV